MKTKTFFAITTGSKSLAGRLRSATRLLTLLVLPVLPAALQAQDYSYTVDNGIITITGYTGSGDAVSIPNQIDGLPVGAIGDWAFDSCASLTSVTIGNSVTSLGYAAFYGCTNLISVTMFNSITNIDDWAFACCDSLASITIPNTVINIPNYAFYDCANLTSVTIPNSVTSLGDWAFGSCVSLTAVYFQGKVPSIGDSAFDGADNGTVYYLPGAIWEATFGNLPTALWNPQVQTSDGSFGVQANRFGFTISGTSNIVVLVEACTDLANPNWCPLQTNTLTGGSLYFSDPLWTNYPGRFYRLRSP